MRGLSLREIRVAHWPRVLLKEATAAIWNGSAVALTTGIAVLVWSGSDGLMLIIAVSMVLSMIIAGVAGAAIPIILTVLGQDPAQSSSILLTTVTDVAGFIQLSRHCDAARGPDLAGSPIGGERFRGPTRICDRCLAGARSRRSRQTVAGNPTRPGTSDSNSVVLRVE